MIKELELSETSGRISRIGGTPPPDVVNSMICEKAPRSTAGENCADTIGESLAGRLLEARQK